MTKNRKWTMIAATGALVVVTALAAVLVLPQAALAAPASATADHRGMPPSGMGMRDMGVQTDTYLADALGITTEELDAAQETARVAAIDQALEQGLITQAQADALKENQRASFGGRLGSRGMSGMMGMFGLDAETDHEALLADALGITVAELQAAQQAAQDARIEQAIADGDLTEEDADMMKARQALGQYMEEQGFFAKAVQAAVDAGIITQEQADSILNRAGAGFLGFGKDSMRSFGGFPSLGGRGGHR